MYQWLIWLGIMLVCGIIAYMGDTLGRKLGKKRLTIFGLRPKRTAILVTSITGCLIFIVALGSVVTISKEYRQWVTNGVESVRELERKQNELREQNKQMGKMVKELDKAAQELKDLKVSIGTTKDALQRAKQELSGANELKKKMTADLARVRQQESTTRGRLDATLQDLKTADESLSRIEGEKGRLTQQNQELIRQNGELGKQTIELEREKQRLEQGNSALVQTKNDLTAETNRLHQQLEDERRRFNIMYDQAQVIGIKNKGLRTSPVLFPVGQEVARLPVKGGAAMPENLNSLDSLMAMAERVAKSEGASPKEDGSVVSMIERMAVNDQGDEVVINPEEIKIAMAREMQKAVGDFVLVASSAINTVQGEPLVVDIGFHPNPIVFSAGDAIADTDVDSSFDDNQLLSNLITFLQSDVAAKSREKGMIPITGPNRSIGNVTYGDLYSLLKRIREVGGRVKVAAYSTGQVRAADRLEIGFRVGPE